MKTSFQKFTDQFSKIFYKEPIKKPTPQHFVNWSPRKKTVLAALASFSTLGASYLAYRYSFLKINIPKSLASSQLLTAFKIIGPLAGLAGVAGVLAYISPFANQTNIPQKERPNPKPDNANFPEIPKVIGEKSEKESSPLPPVTTKSQINLDTNENIKKFHILGYYRGNSTHCNIVKLFKEFHRENEINKNLLEELITKYNDLSTVSPKATISNENFILDMISILKDYQINFDKYNFTLDEKKSNLIKIIDILDVFIGRKDPLSLGLVNDLFSEILPNALNTMIQGLIELENGEYKKLVDRSYQLTYKALTQQLKILFPGALNFELEETDKAVSRILKLLTPFKKDDFRQSPHFYANFFQHSPQLAWRFVEEYILDYGLNNKPTIAEWLNTIEENGNKKNNKSFHLYTHENGLEAQKKIVNGAKRSLFLDDCDEKAAIFAIKLMQHELEIDPKEFETNNPNDYKILKKLYFDLCIPKDLNVFKNFAKGLGDQATKKIADKLISEHDKSFIENHVLCSDATRLRLAFLKQITILDKKKEYKDYSTEEKKIILNLSHDITNQILDPDLLQPVHVKLASLVLNRFPKVFHNVESVELIKEAYHKTQPLKNSDLDSACQNFLKTWDSHNELESEIAKFYAINPEKETDLITQKSKKSQTINENQNTPKTSDKLKIEKLFIDFQTGEKIDKNLLGELITTYNHLSANSPETSILNGNFINDIAKVIRNYQNIVKHFPNLKTKESHLIKIIDILEVFTGRMDLLSCQLVESLSPDIIPNSLHNMTLMFPLDNNEYEGLVDRSCQLVYKAIIQQMKILFCDGLDFDTNYETEKALSRILDLLTPLENDDFRRNPNFYANFIQHSPQHTWRFVQKYVIDELQSNIDLTPDIIIADFLNARYCKDRNNNNDSFPHYKHEDGLKILKKIVRSAKRSLFLDHHDHGAASFAIRIMQHKLKINPEHFEKNYPEDNINLKMLYSELCCQKKFDFFENFAKEKFVNDPAYKIANKLIDEYKKNFLKNHRFRSNATKSRLSFFETIVPLYEKKAEYSEYSDREKKSIQKLSNYIKNQILYPNEPHQIKLASLALDMYPKVFQNVESVNLIREAYRKVQWINNTDLGFSCKKFLEDWDTSQFKLEKPALISYEQIKENGSLKPDNKFLT